MNELIRTDPIAQRHLLTLIRIFELILTLISFKVGAVPDNITLLCYLVQPQNKYSFLKIVHLRTSSSPDISYQSTPEAGKADGCRVRIEL